jgi:hypothetical protein
LKNVFKLNRRLKSERVSRAIRSGWDFYKKNLFEDDETPRSFVIKPRKQIVIVDMYNYAEAISLGCLLHQQIPEAYDMAKKMVLRLIESYQMHAGHFITKIFIGGYKHKYPFLRWPQAQLFYALTNFQKRLNCQ